MKIQYLLLFCFYAFLSPSFPLSAQFTLKPLNVGGYNDLNLCRWIDLNNDNIPEILAVVNNGFYNPYELWIFEKKGDAGYIKKSLIAKDYIDWYKFFIQFVDYDNDNLLDIMVFNNGSPFIYRNIGGLVYEKQIIDIDELSGITAFMVDANFDGRLDLVYQGYLNSSSYISTSDLYINHGNNSFLKSENDFYKKSIGFSRSHGPYWFDISGNGWLDYIFENEVYKNIGDNLFKGDISPFIRNDEFNDIGDYNNDGTIDLLSSKLIVYKNENNVFNGFPIENTENINSYRFIDIDNDNDLDIVSLGKFQLYRNEGDIFTTYEIPYLTSQEIFINDYDNDEDLDILVLASKNVLHNNPQRIFILENNSRSPKNDPAIPIELNAEVKGRRVNFTWDKGDVAQNVYFALGIGSLPDKFDIVSPLNSYSQKSNATLKSIEFLPPGKYYWSVQSIGTNNRKSAFATLQSFHIEDEHPIVDNFSPKIIYPDEKLKIQGRYFIDIDSIYLGAYKVAFKLKNTTSIFIDVPNIPLENSKIILYKDGNKFESGDTFIFEPKKPTIGYIDAGTCVNLYRFILYPEPKKASIEWEIENYNAYYTSNDTLFANLHRPSEYNIIARYKYEEYDSIIEVRGTKVIKGSELSVVPDKLFPQRGDTVSYKVNKSNYKYSFSDPSAVMVFDSRNSELKVQWLKSGVFHIVFYHSDGWYYPKCAPSIDSLTVQVNESVFPFIISPVLPVKLQSAYQIADLDNNNFYDILYQQNDSLYVYFNTDTGFNNSPVSYYIKGTIVGIADYDKNDFPDLLTYDGTYIKVYKNNANSFMQAFSLSIGRYNPTWCDYNMNGNLDIIANGSKIICLENIKGNFVLKETSEIHVIGNKSLTINRNTPITVDFNNDGDIDVIGLYNGDLYLYKQKKSYEFQYEKLAEGIKDFVVEDINNDNSPDLVILKLNDDIRVLYNSENSFIEVPVYISHNASVLDWLVFDFNGDDFNDIIVSAYSDKKEAFHVYFGNEDGFTESNFPLFNEERSNYILQELKLYKQQPTETISFFSIGKENLYSYNIINELQTKPSKIEEISVVYQPGLSSIIWESCKGCKYELLIDTIKASLVNRTNDFTLHKGNLFKNIAQIKDSKYPKLYFKVRTINPSFQASSWSDIDSVLVLSEMNNSIDFYVSRTKSGNKLVFNQPFDNIISLSITRADSLSNFIEIAHMDSLTQRHDKLSLYDVTASYDYSYRLEYKLKDKIYFSEILSGDNFITGYPFKLDLEDRKINWTKNGVWMINSNIGYSYSFPSLVAGRYSIHFNNDLRNQCKNPFVESPLLDLSEFSIPIFRFDWASVGSGKSAKFSVSVSSDNGLTWEEIRPQLIPWYICRYCDNDKEQLWSNAFYDLSKYKNELLKIRINTDFNYLGDVLHLDNLQIKEYEEVDPDLNVRQEFSKIFASWNYSDSITDYTLSYYIPGGKIINISSESNDHYIGYILNLNDSVCYQLAYKKPHELSCIYVEKCVQIHHPPRIDYFNVTINEDEAIINKILPFADKDNILDSVEISFWFINGLFDPKDVQLEKINGELVFSAVPKPDVWGYESLVINMNDGYFNTSDTISINIKPVKDDIQLITRQLVINADVDSIYQLKIIDRDTVFSKSHMLINSRKSLHKATLTSKTDSTFFIKFDPYAYKNDTFDVLISAIYNDKYYLDDKIQAVVHWENYMPELELPENPVFNLSSITSFCTFHFNDRETTPDELLINFSSKNPEIIPDKNIKMTIRDNIGILLFNSFLKEGHAQITISISDGKNEIKKDLKLVISPDGNNTAPIVEMIPDIYVYQTHRFPISIQLKVFDKETLSDNLDYSFMSYENRDKAAFVYKIQFIDRIPYLILDINMKEISTTKKYSSILQISDGEFIVSQPINIYFISNEEYEELEVSSPNTWIVDEEIDNNILYINYKADDHLLDLINISIASSNEMVIPSSSIKMEIIGNQIKLCITDTKIAGSTDLIVSISDGVTIVSSAIELTIVSKNLTTPVNPSLTGQINVYPVPTKNDLTIDFGKNVNKKNITLILRDINGLIVYHNTNYVTEQIKLKVNELNEGLYILSIYHSDTIIKQVKIMILK